MRESGRGLEINTVIPGKILLLGRSLEIKLLNTISLIGAINTEQYFKWRCNIDNKYLPREKS